MTWHPLKTTLAVTAITLLLALPRCANAGLALDPAAISAGYTLTTFADGFSPTTSSCCGPLGITFPVSGGVLVAEHRGNVRLFSNTDGQHAGDVAVAQNYGMYNGVGLASLGAYVYLAEQADSKIVRLNNDGTYNSDVVALPVATGLVANPLTSLLYSSGFGYGIYSIDPNAATPSANLFRAGTYDGLSLDLVNGIIYAAAGDNHIYGYALADASQVFDSGSFSEGPDGIAIGSGDLAGKIFVNTTSGTVHSIDLATNARTLIASGGSRGDFVSSAPDGTLLLTQTDQILRLTAPAGSGFQAGTPEPGTVVTLLGGLGALVLGLRRRRAGTGANETQRPG